MTTLLYILIFLLLIMVYGISKKIVGQYKCVGEHKLEDFFNGKLKGDERRQVVSHLGVCSKCQQRLLEIQKQD